MSYCTHRRSFVERNQGLPCPWPGCSEGTCSEHAEGSVPGSRHGRIRVFERVYHDGASGGVPHYQWKWVATLDPSEVQRLRGQKEKLEHKNKEINRQQNKIRELESALHDAQVALEHKTKVVSSIQEKISEQGEEIRKLEGEAQELRDRPIEYATLIKMLKDQGVLREEKGEYLINLHGSFHSVDSAKLTQERDTLKQQLEQTHKQVAEVATMLVPDVVPDAWGLYQAARIVQSRLEDSKKKLQELQQKLSSSAVHHCCQEALRAQANTAETLVRRAQEVAELRDYKASADKANELLTKMLDKEKAKSRALESELHNLKGTRVHESLAEWHKKFFDKVDYSKFEERTFAYELDRAKELQRGAEAQAEVFLQRALKAEAQVSRLHYSNGQLRPIGSVWQFPVEGWRTERQSYSLLFNCYITIAGVDLLVPRALLETVKGLGGKCTLNVTVSK